MDRAQALAAGGEVLLARWLDVTLTAGLRLPEDESEETRELLLAGARAALAELAPEGAGIGERIQAVQFLCANAAAMDWQARANSPFLPEPARHRAQRFASQMMGLTSRQLATLARLEAERRKSREVAERQTWRRRAQDTKEQLARGNAFLSEMERLLSAGVDVDGMLENAAGAAGPPAPAPRALGAAVPEPPAEPEPPLNRRQRRALERLCRKQARHSRGP